MSLSSGVMSPNESHRVPYVGAHRGAADGAILGRGARHEKKWLKNKGRIEIKYLP